jgi:hypothetical protein
MRRVSAAATEHILSDSDDRSSGFSAAGEPVFALAAVSRVADADERIAAAPRRVAGSQDEFADDSQTSFSAVKVNYRRDFRLYTI